MGSGLDRLVGTINLEEYLTIDFRYIQCCQVSLGTSDQPRMPCVRHCLVSIDTRKLVS